jgi:FKBP-type peptidyl-prolyl cis-trans isomerase
MKKWAVVFALVSMVFVGCKDDKEDPNAQLNAELKLIDERLEQLGLTDKVLYDNTNGLRFVVHHYGEGPPPHLGQKVKITDVAGRLFSDGTIFTTGDINAKLDDVLPQGLAYSLGAFLEGTSATVYIPSKYGFGAAGTTGVPSNSIVVYDLFLEKVERTTEQQAKFQSDTSLISEFVIAQEIDNVIKHPSGIFYTIDVPGTGVSPIPYANANFEYKLKLLNQPTQTIQSNTLVNQNIFGLIDGLKIGLPLINVGTKATFYIPSGLGYGTSSSGTIPANSNLIFEITLTAVTE